MTGKSQYLLAVVAGVFIILAGTILLTTTVAGEFGLFGWLLVAIGVLSVVANVAIRTERL